MKVYVITQGAYSNYKILATTLNKELAQNICHTYNKNVRSNYVEDDEYMLEEYELIENIEDFDITSLDIYFQVSYDSSNKEVKIDTSFYEYERDEIYINEGNKDYTYYITLKSNGKNLMGYEKIIAEKVAQIDYEIQTTFNGDVKKYVENWRSINKNSPF